RSDGLMLIKQYKALSNDLALKIKQMVPGVLPAIVLSPKYSLEAFNESQHYNNDTLITELEKICSAYSEYMQVPLEMSALIDARTRIKDSNEAPEEANYSEDSYISFLCKSPFFSTFEKRLESSHLQLRAKKTKERLINTIRSNQTLLDKLNDIKDYKDIILLHSINTTCLTLTIGLSLELAEEDLVDLAVTNLLIDISVAQIPKEQFESHLKTKILDTAFYNIHLEQLKKLSQDLAVIRKESIIFGVLDQYEYYNGKGYPKGKKESDISLFGRIISIAQAYDEMVGGYFYNNGIRPIHALQNIWEGRGAKFDPNIIRIFIDRTTVLKVGQHIIHSSVHQGTILGFTDFVNYPLSPIIELQNGNIVDLLEVENNKKDN
ncbi:MAG TPA: HD domain-containing phosphohydrolase, partial [Patescibacteria group bacterium]|nr:HD domain-containing phosphohydrolase [Patescibacteria group bacterium]